MNKKAVIFDFDGTLSSDSSNIWQDCWRALGFPKEVDASLCNDFLNGKFGYSEWVRITMDLFKGKGFNEKFMSEIAKKTKLKSNVGALFTLLKSDGFDIFVITGGLCNTVKIALGESEKQVKKIYGNRLSFDSNGAFVEVIPTQFDEEGKAALVSFLCKKHHYDPSDVLFVGNDRNDEFVYMSGCRTLCITPTKQAHPSDKVIWTEGYEEKIASMLNLYQGHIVPKRIEYKGK